MLLGLKKKVKVIQSIHTLPIVFEHNSLKGFEEIWNKWVKRCEYYNLKIGFLLWPDMTAVYEPCEVIRDIRYKIIMFFIF